MLVIALSCFCILLLLTTCLSLHFYVCGEQEVSDLQSYIRDLNNDANNLNRRCNKVLSCKCCGSFYNFNEHYDFNFCSKQCDEECEL